MVGLSRGAAVFGWVWLGSTLLSACGGDSVESPSDAGAAGETTGVAGGVAATGGTGAVGGAGATGGTGAVGGVAATGGTGAVGGDDATGGTGAVGGDDATGKGGVGSGAGPGGGGQSSVGGTGSGAVSGRAGESGARPVSTCEDVREEYAAELERIQSCTDAAECGQNLRTGCGCTRSLVGRLDADTTRFDELLRTSIDGESCVARFSTCDCPNADGFVCNDGRCAWNYLDAPPTRTCAPAPIGEMCVVGVPNDSGGQVLTTGNPLMIEFHPYGCFSSSCSELSAGCRIQSLADNTFMADATLQVCQRDAGGGCTADCSGPEPQICDTSLITRVLGEGRHEVELRGGFGLSLTFDVPSTIPATGLCVAIPQPL